MTEYKVLVFDTYTIWYLNGKLHREDGPAIEYTDGTTSWYLNGKRHRTDGPACEYTDGDKEWWVNGKRHRTDGPAVEFADGSKAWWINGNELTEKEFNKRLQSDPCDGKVIEVDGKKYKLQGI